MQASACLIFNYDVLIRSAIPAGAVWLVQSIAGNNPLHFKHHLWAQGLIYKLQNVSHSFVVVQNHPLTTRARLATFLDHCFRDFSSCRCSLKLA